MQIDPAKRLARLNVRELAQFQSSQSVVPTSPTPSRWRAAVGQQWHDNLKSHAEKEPGEATFEKTFKTCSFNNGWQVDLTGKVDQYIEHEGKVIIREIKTISRNLPMEEEELLEHYPSYFAQIEIYLSMALDLQLAEPDKLSGELAFVSITESIIQTVRISPCNLSLYFGQLRKFYHYLEIRRNNFNRLRELRFRPPFPSWREGQEDTLHQLRQHSESLLQEPILLEAPTGFGKTGVALQYAFEQLQTGQFDKLFILTGKSTGQNQILHQIQGMQDNGSPRYLQMRNREEHAIQTPTHTCNGRDCRKDLEEKWKRSGIDPLQLFNSGSPTLQEVRELGAKTGVCPYEITRSAIPHADVLIGDFNYVFSPKNNTLLLEQEGLSLSRVLLLIDEVHNLPDRVRDNLSAETSHGQARLLVQGLHFIRAQKHVLTLAECWADYLQTIEATAVLPLNEVYQMEDQLSELLDELLGTHMDWEEFPDSASEALREMLYIRKLMSESGTPYLFWSPSRGVFRMDCLEPANSIANSLAEFGRCLMISATISPINQFARSCGLPTDTSLPFIQAQAPWRKEAYRLAIDTRVDTSFKTRAAFFGKTAQTIHQFAQSSECPIVAYFPSYQYAEDLLPIIRNFDPPLPVTIQARNLSLNEQNEFLQKALHQYKILLLILGGSYAEGIDMLGEHIQKAIIVGPSLPVTDHIQRTRMERLQVADPEDAYHQICRQPALIRIRQAIGRMVRAPGQKADILFHCCRFLQPHYRTLFEEQTPDLIRSDEELSSWLQPKSVMK
jgi:DNA excision repair protein ERCC-2